MKFAHRQSQTRFPLYQCMYQVWLQCHDIYSSYCPENENTGVSRADNCQNLPISNPKPDLHNINTHTMFEQNTLMFTQVTIRKGKMEGQTDRHTIDRQTDRWMDRHMDIQCETIIPRHYPVAGYKNHNIPPLLDGGL